MHKPSLSSHSAGGRTVGRVPFAHPWWSSGGHHRRGLGIGGAHGMERVGSTSFFGNPLARNTSPSVPAPDACGHHHTLGGPCPSCTSLPLSRLVGGGES